MGLSEREQLVRWRSSFLCAIAQGKPLDETAQRVYQWALEIEQENVVALNGLGRVALDQKQYPLAKRYFEAAARIHPTDVRLLLNAAVASNAMGERSQAEQWARRAIALDPRCSKAYIMLVNVAEQLDRPDRIGRAIHEGLKAIPQDRELRFAQGCLELKRGEFSTGWADYEFRTARLEMLEKLDEVPEWRGESLEGKTLLVSGEQGFGDQIMFGRYLAKLPPAKDVVVYTNREVARLFSGFHVVTSDRELVKLDIDYWVLMGSLPHVLQIDPPLRDRLPVIVTPDHANRFRDVFLDTGNLRVGLAWAGNSDHYRDRERSFSFEQFQELLRIPGCDFYSLQYGDTASGLDNLCAYSNDWQDYAALISHLDLVISADTGIAHLAASMGKETWILLSRASDWRWGLPATVKNTPWYPAVHCYQQKRMGDWAEPIARVRTDLETMSGIQGRQPRVEDHGQSDERPARDQGITILRRESRYGEIFFFAADQWLGRSLDLYGEWSESEVALFGDLVHSGDTVVEVGANIGSLTLPLAELVGDAGRVLAFEPVAATFNLLDRNTNHLQQVHLIQQGLGRTPGFAAYESFEDQPISNPGGTTLLVGDAPGQNRTTVSTLDSCALPALHFLKIDVEGMELDVLEGADETIRRCQPVIYAENDRAGATEALLAWFTAHGYRVYQHLAPLYNPDNFRGYRVNVFGSIVSMMLLAMPRGRYLEQTVLDRHELSRLRIQQRTN